MFIIIGAGVAAVVLIVHNGARVDHVCSYVQLKQPNVLAADVLVALATRGARPPPAMVFISSISALAWRERGQHTQRVPRAPNSLLAFPCQGSAGDNSVFYSL